MMTLLQLPARTTATLAMYHKNFHESACTSYRRVAATQPLSSVVAGDEAKTGWSVLPYLGLCGHQFTGRLLFVELEVSALTDVDLWIFFCCNSTALATEHKCGTGDCI